MQLVGEVEQQLDGDHAVVVGIGELVFGKKPPTAAAGEHLCLGAWGALPPEHPRALDEFAQVLLGISVAHEVGKARYDVRAAQDEGIELLVGVARRHLGALAPQGILRLLGRAALVLDALLCT